MLLEHVFFTNLEAEPALRSASAMLGEMGFSVATSQGRVLNAWRGADRTDVSTVRQLPQWFRLEFDRGRVAVAASITPAGDRDEPIHDRLMESLVISVQDLLGRGLPSSRARLCWEAAEAEAARTSIYPARRIRLAVVAAAAAVVLLLILAALW